MSALDNYYTGLELFVGTKEYTVNTAPKGLLLLEGGTIICKSEYGQYGNPECIIISSGENYCGGDKKCIALQIN